MHTSIIVDDDCSSLELISDYIDLQSNIKLVKKFNNSLMALKEILELNKPIDILFIDVEMPKMNGIELARLVNHKAKKLIFITGHTKYAFDSYDVEADAYLLKPFSFSKFSQTLNKVLLKQKNHLNQRIDHNFILLKNKDRKTFFIKVYLKNIIAVESQNKEVKIYTADEVIFAHSSLSGMLKLLGSTDNFVQIHKSFIISQNHIKGIGRKYVLLFNNLEIPIGRVYKDFYYKTLI
jgi:DNA-binding LytR/AlgR family response regulator